LDGRHSRLQAGHAYEQQASVEGGEVYPQPTSPPGSFENPNYAAAVDDLPEGPSGVSVFCVCVFETFFKVFVHDCVVFAHFVWLRLLIHFKAAIVDSSRRCTFHSGNIFSPAFGFG
jgi:hypothetical protein